MTTLTLAAIQLTSTPRIADNIATMQKLVAQAAAQGADWVLLPEYWAIMGLRDADKLAHAEPYGAGILQTALAQAAQQHQIHLFGGTIPLASNTPSKVHNSLLVYSPSSECLSRYDKIHLFNYQAANERYCESDTLVAGETIPQLEINGWRVAQGICYDLRFPELFRAQSPADIIMLPAAFTQTPGKAPLGAAAARPRRGKPMLSCCRRANRHARKRTAHLRAQHDYRPVGRHHRHSA